MKQQPIGPFTSTGKLVLASGSPRRRELLGDLGLDFEVCPSPMEEPAPLAEEKADAYACRMAELKTKDVAKSFTDATILGADTIVVLNNRIMGKPKNAGHALEMLTALSDQTHQVTTAFCLVLPDGEVFTQAVTTDVDMRKSGETELKSYIATGEPTDKAGAYAIQGIGTFLVTGIRGSYTNVVGLPVARVLDILLAKKLVQPNS